MKRFGKRKAIAVREINKDIQLWLDHGLALPQNFLRLLNDLDKVINGKKRR